MAMFSQQELRDIISIVAKGMLEQDKRSNDFRLGAALALNCIEDEIQRRAKREQVRQ